ncbi:VanZ family protein [Halobacillus sp. SY10]|uniref:VanZ like family protein n=1 Tax=Halobacillus aidingensis TaxID=240303 RepID=A0A1H0G8W3_HALAD|nr:VanZ family protein [Halobacillus aidingensis]SDO03189.1 VanZ like family protein [Halobacillus aidingensis]
MSKVQRIIMSLGFIGYILFLVFYMFFQSRGAAGMSLSLFEYIQSRSNLIPFKTIANYITALQEGTMNTWTAVKNLLGNVLVFTPMGIFLPALFRKLDRLRAFLLAFVLIILSAEVAQLLTQRGSFDIDDFILNLFGAWLGFKVWVTSLVQKWVGRGSYE